MRKRDDFVTVLIVFVLVTSSVASGTLVLIYKDPLLGQAITTFTAVVGACAIWVQMQKGKRLNEGEFIVGLNKQFIENESIYRLFLKMEKYERSDKKTNPFTEDDIAQIAGYMTFFEVIYSLITRKIIKIWMIDDLFAYQFFLLINNRHIQDLELLPCQAYYVNVYRLAYMWEKYRLKNGASILNRQDRIFDRLSVKLNG